MPEQISSQELHTPANDPNHLDVAPGVQLSQYQRTKVAIIIDLFQGKGSMSKLKDAFAEDGVYEDEFAISGGIEQVAGQLVNVSRVAKSTQTNTAKIISNSPSNTTNAKGETISCDEILVDWDHEITFHSPLPDGLSTMHLDTTLHIFIEPKEGKVVRLMDHSKEELQESSLPNFIRKLNSVAVPKVTGLPSNEKEDSDFVKKTQR